MSTVSSNSDVESCHTISSAESLSDANEEQENLEAITSKYKYNRPSFSYYQISSTCTNEQAMMVQSFHAVLRKKIQLKLRLQESELDNVTAASLFKELFLSADILRILQEICSSRLIQLKEPYCNEEEILQAVALVLASAFYGRFVSALLEKSNADVYNTPEVNSKRILLIIRSMEGHQAEVYGSNNSPMQHVNNDIDSLEEAFSSICCSIACVLEMNLSADDDLVRLRSKRVTQTTNLKQINIPGKVMGCVQTTIACPLTNITLSSRYSVRNESYSKTLQILLRRIQMKTHDHLVDFEHLSTTFLDRGYVSEKVLSIINDANLHLVGTQNRGEGSPFAFGTEQDSGDKMFVKEKEILSEYWAKRKWNGGVTTHRLAIREERMSGGKVTMLITTRDDLAGGNWSVKPKKAGAKVGSLHKKLSIDKEKLSDVAALVGNVGEQLLNEMEEKVNVLTDSQSGCDKLWFVARGIHFTSTVGIHFLRLLSKQCTNFIVSIQTRKQIFAVVGVGIETSSDTAAQEIPTVLQENVIRTWTKSKLKEEGHVRNIKGYSRMSISQLVDSLKSWTLLERHTLTIEENFSKIALESWCMKPRKASESMQTGTQNEVMIRKTISAFLEEHAKVYTIGAREYGLIGTKNNADIRLATSPDMIGVIFEPHQTFNANNPSQPTTVVYEFKTFSSSEKLQTASIIRDAHVPYI